MKYVLAFGTGDRRAHRELEDGSTRQSIAMECREAALSFMSGVAIGWDKLDLAHWLTDAYRHVTRHGKHGERVSALYEIQAKPREVSEVTIERLVAGVRDELIGSLEKAANEFGALDFADDMVARGLVQKVLDADGRDAWIPVDGSRVLLRDRLRSLFAADFLNAPYTYTELFVCLRCEAVVFDGLAKEMGICSRHRVSGLILAGEADVDNDDA